MGTVGGKTVNAMGGLLQQGNLPDSRCTAGHFRSTDPTVGAGIRHLPSRRCVPDRLINSWQRWGEPITVGWVCTRTIPSLGSSSSRRPRCQSPGTGLLSRSRVTDTSTATTTAASERMSDPVRRSAPPRNQGLVSRLRHPSHRKRQESVRLISESQCTTIPVLPRSRTLDETAGP